MEPPFHATTAVANGAPPLRETSAAGGETDGGKLREKCFRAQHSSKVVGPTCEVGEERGQVMVGQVGESHKERSGQKEIGELPGSSKGKNLQGICLIRKENYQVGVSLRCTYSEMCRIKVVLETGRG